MDDLLPRTRILDTAFRLGRSKRRGDDLTPLTVKIVPELDCRFRAVVDSLSWSGDDRSLVQGLCNVPSGMLDDQCPWPSQEGCVLRHLAAGSSSSLEIRELKHRLFRCDPRPQSPSGRSA